MTGVRIVGLRPRLEVTLEALQGVRLVELEPAHERDEQLSPLPEAERLEGRAEELRALADELRALLALGVEAGLPDPGAPEGAAADAAGERVRAEIRAAGPPLRERARRIDGLREEQAALRRYVGPLESVLPLLPGLAELDRRELARLRLDTAALVLDGDDAGLVDLLRAELHELLGRRFELATRRVDDGALACLLVYPHEDTDALKQLLALEQVRHVALPERYERLSLAEAVGDMRQRLAELPHALDRVRAELAEMLAPRAESWRTDLASLRSQIERLEARVNVGVTERAFVVVGWIPRGRLGALRSAVEEGAVIIEEAPVRDGEQAPVLLENPGPVRPYETLVRFLELPRPGTLDPSILLAVFLPLMFGIMVGDVVYGLVLLGLALWVRRRYAAGSPVAADMSRIMVAGSLWAIAFGFVFGEALGNAARRVLGMDPLWFYRGSPDAIEPLFLFVLALGSAHVVLGLVLGLWQSARAGERHQLLDRASTLVAICAAIGLGAVALDVLPTNALPVAGAALLVALVGLIVLQGTVGPIMGPVELAGAVGNVFSYLRLAAVGLASVYLAIVANEFVVALPLAIGVLVATLLHTLNLALAGFSPMVQSLRLHYVEFFSKFYAGGGRPFRPFGANAPAN